jgi:hypothetical protein
MEKSKYANKKDSLNRVFLFLSTYWKELSLLALIAPFLYRYYLDQAAANDAKEKSVLDKKSKTENKKYSPKIQMSKIDTVLKGIVFKDKAQKDRIITAAKSLPYHLGTQFFFENDYLELSLNHRSWTENDKEIEKILIANPVNYWLLERLYFEVFTPGRNLTTDILKYLDSDSLARVRASWKKSNKFI